MPTESLKDDYYKVLIPGIESMILKEKIHYEYLSTFDKKDYPMVEVFLAKSESFLQLLNERLTEYIQYASIL